MDPPFSFLRRGIPPGNPDIFGKQVSSYLPFHIDTGEDPENTDLYFNTELHFRTKQGGNKL